MKNLLKFFLLLTQFYAVTLSATGLFIYEISAERTRLGSAGWCAQADAASTVFTNPAGMALFCEPHLEASLQALYANIKFDSNAQTNVSGADGRVSPWIPTAGLYYVKPLSSRFAVGFGSLGFFGSKLKYNSNWMGRYYLTETTLQGFATAFAASYKVTDKLSIGAGYTPSLGIFEQKARVNNILDSLPDGKLKLKDNAWGQGYFLGALYSFSPCTRIGIQYLSSVKFHFKDKPSFKDVGPTLSALLEVTGLEENQVKLNVRNPQMVMAGFYHQFSPCLAVMGDVGWQEWSKFGYTQITLGTSDQTTLTFPMKYWNGWHYSLGVEYRFRSDLILSMGTAYDTSIVPKDQRTFNLPVGKQWRLGSGFEWQIDCRSSLTASYTFCWTGDLSMNQNRGPLAGNVAGTYPNIAVHFMNFGYMRTF